MGVRLFARQCGLTVKITNVPKLDATADERVSAGGVAKNPQLSCVAYKVPVDSSVEGFDEVLLLKIPLAPTRPVTPTLPGWVLAQASMQAQWQRLMGPSFGAEALAEQLDKLPEDCVAWGCDGRFVSCYWRERAQLSEDGSVPEVTQIAAVLNDCKNHLVEQLLGSTAH